MNSITNTVKRLRLAARVWCCVAFSILIVSAVDRWNLAKSISEGHRFLIVDDNTFLYPRSYDFQEAKALHYDQALLAATTLLNRSPNGVDREKRLKALYHPRAFEKAINLINQETPVFQAKSLHQKATIEETHILSLTDQSVMVTVTGQLIRVGEFEGETVVEVMDFELSSQFMFNANMVSNGRYPTIVSDFKLKLKSSSL